MDFSKLPKIRDEDREAFVGYVHGVSGPGRYFVSKIIASVSSSLLLIEKYYYLLTWKKYHKVLGGIFFSFLRRITAFYSEKKIKKYTNKILRLFRFY